MIDPVGWVVPTHPPHFAYAARLAAGVAEHRLHVDLHLVVGTQQEAAELRAALDDTRAHVVVAEDHLPQGRLAQYVAAGSVVHAKKLVGLHLLAERYPLLCALDSETAVLRFGDVRASYELAALRRAFPAHRVSSPLLQQIARSPVRLFPEPERARLTALTGDLYGWFADVPAYDPAVLRRMLTAFGVVDDVSPLADRLVWHDFEHVLYQYWCLLHEGWRLHDTGLPEQPGGAAWWETWTAEDPAAARAHARAWAPSWVSDPALLPDVPSAFLAFHLDR